MLKDNTANGRLYTPVVKLVHFKGAPYSSNSLIYIG